MSHTATGEWKSFEVRMQRRRAERLVLRADAAAAAGDLEEARTSLEEASVLWPAAPGLTDVQRKLETRRIPAAAPTVAPTAASTAPAIAAPLAAPTAAPSRWKELSAATLAVAFGVGAAALLVMTAEPIFPPSPPAVTVSEALPSRDLTAIVEPTAPGHQETANIDQGIADQESGITERAAEIRKPAAVQAELPIPSPPVSRSPIPVPPSAAPPSRIATEPPLRIAADPPSPLPDVAAITAASPTVFAGSRSATVQPPQEPLIRNALARYAAAYSDLDVDAAERVWPTVNRTALRRAFDSLQSQRVLLGECRIDLAGSSSAHASCVGSATWTPKVGGRAHTDARSWGFDLEKSTVGWQIVNARVQNK